MLKLAKFAQEKIKTSGSEKNIKVLAFGHENYMGHALSEYFGEHEIANCETLAIEIDNDGMTGKYRDKEAGL